MNDSGHAANKKKNQQSNEDAESSAHYVQYRHNLDVLFHRVLLCG
jgi:hypothetical protein